MILQALYDYYLRRQCDADPARRLPAFGLEHKAIAFILEIDESGRLHAIVDVRQIAGKKKFGAKFLVPKGIKKTLNIGANLLWDNAEYVLALPDVKKMDEARARGAADKYLARLQAMHKAFRTRISALFPLIHDDAGVRGVLAFLDRSPATQASRFEAYADIVSTNPVLTFRLVGNANLVCQSPSVVQCLASADLADLDTDKKPDLGVCLITGNTAPIERIHPAIRNVHGAQTSGANIVSFNGDAFSSYGKAQGSNAPVSQVAAFAYTTALNALLAPESSQRIQIGDTSTVFWAQKPDAMEHNLVPLLNMGNDPDARTQQVRDLFRSVFSGEFTLAQEENRFYVLGLAPNGSRLSVRFWHAAPISAIAERVTAWFGDLAIVRHSNDPEFLSLYHLLAHVAPQSDIGRLPPILVGGLVRSIFAGGPCPASWLNAAIRRCRTDRRVGYVRAAIIKICLNRSLASSDLQHKKIQTMLDTENPSTAYRLGRLFATLEKIQKEANPRMRVTIRDHYYGSASSTPAAVFSRLMRMKTHHLAKIWSRKRAASFERLIDDIISGIDGFPPYMSLHDQGRFAVGYYHQRRDFFTKRESAETTADERCDPLDQETRKGK